MTPRPWAERFAPPVRQTLLVGKSAGKPLTEVPTEHLKEALEYMRRTQPKEAHLKAIYAARFRAVEYELGVRL